MLLAAIDGGHCRAKSRAAVLKSRKAEMMSAEVRAASVEDAHAIADIHIASWQAAYAGQLPSRYLDGLSADNRTSTWVEVLLQEPPTAVFVIGADDHLMGFAAVGASRDDDAPSGQVGEVAAIYALDEAWGRGMGRQLMAKALQHLRATGFEDATLATRTGRLLFALSSAAAVSTPHRRHRGEGPSAVQELDLLGLTA